MGTGLGHNLIGDIQKLHWQGKERATTEGYPNVIDTCSKTVKKGEGVKTIFFTLEIISCVLTDLITEK